MLLQLSHTKLHELGQSVTQNQRQTSYFEGGIEQGERLTTFVGLFM